jgi:RNA polymerase sigma-70 factor (ECF subfamily)
MPLPLTDEKIVKQVQQGQTELFGLLVERYEAKIKRYGRKFLYQTDDIDDLVQDIMIKTFVNIQSFKTDKRFSPWIYRIAHNEFINAIKKKSKDAVPFFDPDTLFPHPVAKEKTDGPLQEEEIRATVEQYLEKLEVKYREPLILYYLEELSYQEIADILHLPTSTVGVRIKRAKDALQKIHQATNQK